MKIEVKPTREEFKDCTRCTSGIGDYHSATHEVFVDDKWTGDATCSDPKHAARIMEFLFKKEF